MRLRCTAVGSKTYGFLTCQMNRTEQVNPATVYYNATFSSSYRGSYSGSQVYGWLKADFARASEVVIELFLQGSTVGASTSTSGTLYFVRTDYDPTTLCWNNQPALIGDEASIVMPATAVGAPGSFVSGKWPLRLTVPSGTRALLFVPAAVTGTIFGLNNHPHFVV